MKNLSQAEQEDVLLQVWRTYEYVQKQGKDVPDMWKTQLPLLPLRLGKRTWGPPCSRMAEWIGYKSARFLSDKFQDRRDDTNYGEWYEAEGYSITNRIHLPLEKEAPHYGCMYRLDDISQYMDEVWIKLGAILDGEVIRDLCNHSPILGTLEPRKNETIKNIGQATMQAILECVNDISQQTTRRIGPGHGFAIMPRVVAEMVMAAENIRLNEDAETELRRGVGTTYWGTGSGQVALYSHTDLTDKIVVGFKPDDIDQCAYIFRPYSYGIWPGPDTEGHAYHGKMQLTMRRMKRLVDGGCGLYGVIQYKPQPMTWGKMVVPLINRVYPQL